MSTASTGLKRILQRCKTKNQRERERGERKGEWERNMYVFTWAKIQCGTLKSLDSPVHGHDMHG